MLAMPFVASAQATDVIRGRVIAVDSTPLPNAIVTATDTVAKTTVRARSDSTGAFRLSFENGRGTYAVSVTMLGYAPQHRSVSRRADNTLPLVDFTMSPVATTLGATRTVAQRPRAARSDVNGDYSIGGATNYASLSNGLTGDVTGDPTSMLATLPGIMVTPSETGLPTVSAFGVGSDQNGLVLNGMGFGALVPRDGFRLALISSSYDPSHGGYAGVQLSLRMFSGNNTISRSLHGTLDAPSLQWTSPVSSNLGTRYGQQVVSGLASGPIERDRVFYSTSFQWTRRASALTSLASADPSSLAALNVSADSVQRLLGQLAPFDIPIRTSGVPSQRQNVEGRVAARIDWEPNLQPSPPGVFFVNNSTIDDYYLEAGGTYRTNDGTLVGPLSLPSFGTQQTHRDGWMQLSADKYLPKNILNETTVSLNGGDDHSDTYLDEPAARVLVASPRDDGTSAISTVQVGGSSNPRAESRTWSSELRNQTTWNSWNRRHTFSITFDGTEDGYSLRQDAGFGTFLFNSLADFANGAPASYLRTLNGLSTSGHGFSGAIGIGETYDPAPRGMTPPGKPQPSVPTVQYGVRIETNHFGVRPAYNAAIDTLFGLRTDHVPNAVRVTPMLGFAWPIFPEFHLPTGLNLGRRGEISGGVREYRGTLSTRTIDAYTRQTGLPDAIQQLYCVGAATPAPDWSAYAASLGAIPTECVPGTESTPLAQTAPNVALFAPDYDFYDSWRPTLSFSYILSRRLRLELSGTEAYNRDVPGSFDVNFDGTPRFTLADEGGRPVYVSPSSIVAATGTPAWTDSRRSTRFAHVTEARSDLHSETRTFGGTLNFQPFAVTINSGLTYGSIGYTYTDARDQFRGFGGSTAGDPTVLTWGRSAVPRHTITAQITKVVRQWGTAGLQARIQSGVPFTPIVAGDINGDGYVNDRAFVFDPAAAANATVASAMSDLLADAPPSARRCLRAQLGSVAARNSCVGPWSMPMLNLQVTPDPYRFGFKNRGSIQLLLTNVLSGIDQALHGSNHLHGWGQYAFPDPTLLTVRGFDPATQRYTYAVNPLFGSTAQFRNIFRAPFRITLDVRLNIEPDRETQYLESLLRVGKSAGDTLTEQEIKQRIARGFNPLNAFIVSKDSLHLSTAQVDSIKAISQRYATVRDSIVTVLARYLLARRGNYGGEEVRQHWHSAGIASYAAYVKEARSAIGVLTPEQRERTKQIPQLLGILTIETIKDSDLAGLLRGPMPTLP